MTLFPIGAQVGADTTTFIGAMGGATRGLTAFTGAAGLGAVAIGVFAGAAGIGLAIGAAREFQVELVKLNTLVGIQTEQIQAWEGSIKDLAVETGKAPADLARAMFAITSGGARGQDALDLLESAATASAQGLGDMTAIGRTATAMLQAFGDEGLMAEKAIDIMVATVREGNLEASSLAQAFSRVLGPAKALGSNVEDIGGFLATFTRLGGSTEEAATGLLNVFNLLIKPPKDARESMLQMGISIEEVRATIEEDGLVAGLALMKDAIGDNIDALGKVVPNTRALIGFLNTASLQSEEFAAITDRVTNSLGLNAEGFDTWSQSADAAQTRFGAQLKVLAVSVGDIFLPALNAVLGKMGEWLGAINDIVERMSEIPGPSEEVTEALGRFTAAVGRMDRTALERQLGALPDSIRDTTAAIGVLRTEMALLESTQGEIGREGRAEEFVRILFIKEEIAELIEQRNLEAAQLVVVEAAIGGLVEARDKESKAVERTIELSEEEKEAKEKREKAVADLVLRLDEELFALQRGEAALIDRQLEELQASDATRQYVQDILANITAEEALTEAQEKSTRQLQTLKRERERAAATAQRKVEREELARLNAEMAEATRIARDFSESIAVAFESVIDRTKSMGEAFRDMVTEILKQIQRLLIQQAIVEPLIGTLLGAFGPGSGGGGGGGGGGVATSTSVLPGDISLTRASHKPGHFSISTGGQSGGGGAVIVQQTINFSPNMIDQRSGVRFIREHGGEIAMIMGEGVQQSSQLADALRGG